MATPCNWLRFGWNRRAAVTRPCAGPAVPTAQAVPRHRGARSAPPRHPSAHPIAGRPRPAVQARAPSVQGACRRSTRAWLHTVAAGCAGPHARWKHAYPRPTPRHQHGATAPAAAAARANTRHCARRMCNRLPATPAIAASGGPLLAGWCSPHGCGTALPAGSHRDRRQPPQPICCNQVPYTPTAVPCTRALTGWPDTVEAARPSVRLLPTITPSSTWLDCTTSVPICSSVLLPCASVR